MTCGVQKLLRVKRQAIFTHAELSELLKVELASNSSISPALVTCLGTLILTQWFLHEEYAYRDRQVGCKVRVRSIDDIRVHYYHYGAAVGPVVYHFCAEDHSACFLQEKRNAGIRGTTVAEFAMLNDVEEVKLNIPSLSFPEARRMAAALSSAAPSAYHLTRFNCEHAARLIVCGDVVWTEVDRVRADTARTLLRYHESVVTLLRRLCKAALKSEATRVTLAAAMMVVGEARPESAIPE